MFLTQPDGRPSWPSGQSRAPSDGHRDHPRMTNFFEQGPIRPSPIFIGGISNSGPRAIAESAQTLAVRRTTPSGNARDPGEIV